VAAREQPVGQLADHALGPAPHLGPEAGVQQGDAHADIFLAMLGGLCRIRREIGEARGISAWLLYLPAPGWWLTTW